MKTVVDYLNDLKEKTGSDYASAKALEITKESVSKIRSRGQMSDETAMKMAELLGSDKGEILMAATLARSRGEVKAAWESISKRAGIAASIMLGTTLVIGISSHEKHDVESIQLPNMYIMLN